MSSLPKISVCMAVYNGERYLRQQIDSVLMQLQAHDELLIYDDLSTDATPTIISGYADDRIQYTKNAQRLGIIKNFERALSQATGDYVFLCDHDDVWLPGKVSECVAVLQTNLLVVTDCKVVDAELNEIYASFFAHRQSGGGVCKNLWKNSYLGCCMAFRKELLTLALPIPGNVPMHDMWLGLIAQIYGQVVFIPQQLSLYRRHGQAASAAAGASQTSLIGKFLYRVTLITCVLKRVILLKLTGKISEWH